MGTVTKLPQRAGKRLDNANCQKGRVFMVLRDATYWMQLHEIGEAIRDRFEVMDSHAAISARIRQLRGLGVVIISREHNPQRGTTRPHEYRMLSSDGDQGGAA